MLDVLHIENIAVIEQAEISFHKGFNVLTGETGAGKSIVIDAISAILGERTYRDMIRTGADRAFVSAIFSDIPEFSWFADNQVPYDPDGLSLQREITLDGKNNCRVNGRPVTVAVLHQLGVQLINIHGQHDSQQLFDEQTHLKNLDAFAKDAPQLSAYRTLFAELEKIRQERSRLEMDETEKERLVETLRYQIDEIESAELTANEEEGLEGRRKILQNAEKMTDALENALVCLFGNDTQDGAEGLLSGAEHALSKISHTDDRLRELYQKTADMLYGTQDIIEELRDLKDGLLDSSAELESIEQRLDVLYRLKRKYGHSSVEILAFLEKAKAQLEDIEFADEKMAKLNEAYEQKRKQASAAAQELHEIRAAAAEKLRSRMEQELAQLDMPRIAFVCEFTETELSQDGTDSVRFLMSANAGEALKPMSKVASGGELARIMLAMKNVMAEQDPVQTLIFDEVDAGISGRAAQKVSEKLCTVSKGKQVLCVTHLPQIAAMAQTHFIVEKQVKNDRTYTSVVELDFTQRKSELARITGGENISKAQLDGAEELLRSAESFRKSLDKSV